MLPMNELDADSVKVGILLGGEGGGYRYEAGRQGWWWGRGDNNMMVWGGGQVGVVGQGIRWGRQGR